MPKLTLDDLKRIKEEAKAATTIREGGHRAKITVHMGTCGIAAGARAVMSAFMDELAKRQIKDVILATAGCAGLCIREPMATVEILGEAPVKYVQLDDRKSREILVEHVIGGRMVEKYALAVGSETTC